MAMDDNVEPIRSHILPVMDAGREMVQYVAEQLANYVSENGEQPAAIAFVFVGPDKAASDTSAYSWTPLDDDRSRLQCCAVASAVLMKRALGI
jgi:hypothetical protein